MIQIPRALMMSEFHAKNDSDLGHVHCLRPRVLDKDNGLAVYIMQEVLKAEKSFYWPYLRVLPTPHNLRHWGGESLLLLQDNKLVRRTAARSRQMRALYRETIEYLSKTYPELYTVSHGFSNLDIQIVCDARPGGGVVGDHQVVFRRLIVLPCNDTCLTTRSVLPSLAVAVEKAERYTFELFDFAWSTVQARAFGKRLKSSALVPFADCLNHGNVQTK